MQTVSYEELVENEETLLDVIEKAYGPNGLGILTISGVPDYAEARTKLLPLIRDFGILPDDIKQQFERKELNYQFGWSHGIEMLQSGKPDVGKGSYYANPSTKENFSNSNMAVDHNIWPSEFVPSLEAAFFDISSIMTGVAFKVADLCDRFALNNGQKVATMKKVVDNSTSSKGRLLYYFPTCDSAVKMDQWCGWHCDHSTLTCLTKAMYFDKDGLHVSESLRDDLVIQARNKEQTSMSIPVDSIAIQIGQAAQIDSNGVFLATPHAVSVPAVADISRATYALFLQPDWNYLLKCDMNLVQPEAMHSMPEQYQSGMTFGEFSDATVKKFYRSNLE